MSCTIASACNHLFRALFLQDKTIGLVPPGGYSKKHKRSVVANKYLDWLEHSEGITLEREVEFRVGGHKFKVDGYHRPTNTIVEFNGQIWHGCRCLTNREATLPGSEKTVEEAWQATQLKKKLLEEAGHDVREYWECCDLKHELEESHEMKTFFDQHPAPSL